MSVVTQSLRARFSALLQYLELYSCSSDATLTLEAFGVGREGADWKGREGAGCNGKAKALGDISGCRRWESKVRGACEGLRDAGCSRWTEGMDCCRKYGAGDCSVCCWTDWIGGDSLNLNIIDCCSIEDLIFVVVGVELCTSTAAEMECGAGSSSSTAEMECEVDGSESTMRRRLRTSGS